MTKQELMRLKQPALAKLINKGALQVNCECCTFLHNEICCHTNSSCFGNYVTTDCGCSYGELDESEVE